MLCLYHKKQTPLYDRLTKFNGGCIMGRHISDEIDNCCEEMLGHTNWAYADTISKEQMKKYKKNKDIACIVVFFEDPCEEDKEETNE